MCVVYCANFTSPYMTVMTISVVISSQTVMILISVG